MINITGGGFSQHEAMRPRTGLPLPRQRGVTPTVAPVTTPGLGDDSPDAEVFQGWVKTWAWTLTGALVYVLARWIVELCFPGNPMAYMELCRQVPPIVYRMSSTAFFTALVLNLTSLLFEDNAPKRQLALLSCAIKGAACHTDMLMVTGQTHVVFDAFGKIVIPHRYVQWLVTTPTMVYILSKISDFTPAQTATAIGLDVVMVVSGLWANFLPGPYLKWLMFSVSMFSFIGVLYMMGRMVFSAIKEHANATSRRSLLFIYMCTLLIWNLFPLAWIMHVVYDNPAYGEYLNVFANFMAKVLFSSSIMYGNYITIAQRRLLAQQEAENAHRVRMIQELKDAVTRKDQFMSLMSHELRTPLNGIIQLSDALVRGAGGAMNPKGQHFVRTIKNSSNHLLNIINDILDVAALKEGKLTIKHELCSLSKAVDHVVDIVAPLAKKDVVIERTVDPRTPLIIADFSRVIQILYNLAGNALKFTHKGRVGVAVAPTPDGSSITLKVADTGIGIPADRINGIWGAFEQVDMSVTRKYGGTGLGLNIVKQLVEAHEGCIEVHSVEGRGTTFTVTLPVLQVNTRQSLEEQVLESLQKCGHEAARNAIRKHRARPGSSIEEAISQLARGVTRRASSLTLSAPKEPQAAPESPANGAHNNEVLYRRRTQELERENLLGELQRRTEHKRSMEDAQLVSRHLELSKPERRAERDSRSLERLEEQNAAGVPQTTKAPVTSVSASTTGRPAAGPGPAGGEGGGAAGRGGGGGGSGGADLAVWRAEARNTFAVEGGPSGEPRQRLCTASGQDGDADNARRRSDSANSGAPAGGSEAYEQLLLLRVSNDSCCGGSGGGGSGGGGGCGGTLGSSASLLRKLSNASISGKPGTSSSLALRMSAYGRHVGGPAGAQGGHSGSVPLLVSGGSVAGAAAAGGGASGGSGCPSPHHNHHNHLKSALESDLYRNGCKSFDDASSVGADSESELPRAIRWPAPHSRSGKVPLGGGHGVSGNGLPSNSSLSAALPPPPGLTLDKLAYSDMYGSIQILSVDDEEVNQIVLEEILTSSGYRFARCMDGLEALEWLCASETMPDLILLDCMMPNMSGHEFCATLRKVIPGNVLPVIMVSAKSDEDNIVEGLRSGSNDFVRKPYQREELLARIETQLRLKSDSWWLAELVNNVDGRETESMKLLKNILPESIIARMQQGQKFVADSHSHVVILFSDIVGFTHLSSKLPSAEVFLMLSNMFTAFDKLTDRFSVYKVETIGDAYMVAAGHDEDDDKAKKGSPLTRVLGFARAMLDVVRNITAPNGERMRIRIGVHCGPAFAGVIGMKCPRYCFLGDTVNTASRMESTGFPMCIHVSENVYRHHPTPEVELQEVGEREVKGKGRMRTYLVRVGAWEAALQDYAARQQAAAASLALQQKQLEAAQAWLSQNDHHNPHHHPHHHPQTLQQQSHLQQEPQQQTDVKLPTGRGNWAADNESMSVIGRAVATGAAIASGPGGIASGPGGKHPQRHQDLLLLVPADSFDSSSAGWSPMPPDAVIGHMQQRLPSPSAARPPLPPAAAGPGAGPGAGTSPAIPNGSGAGAAHLAAASGLSNGISRSSGQWPSGSEGSIILGRGLVHHHLSTVTEESSRPASPISVSPYGNNGQMARFNSGGSSTGARSPLSRPDASASAGTASRLPCLSTFGSEAYFCGESSEDGAASTMNGMCTITGMLQSRSGSFTGMVPAAGAVATVATAGNSGRCCSGGGGSGAGPGFASAAEPEASPAAAGGGIEPEDGYGSGAGESATAVQLRDSSRPTAVRVPPDAVTSTAAAAMDKVDGGGGVAVAGSFSDAELSRSRWATAAEHRQFHNQIFSGVRMLSPDSAGLTSGSLPSTIMYLEQRIVSLASKVDAEVAARSKLQDELDAERRRAADALHRAGLLQQQVQAAALAASGGTAGRDLDLAAAAPALAPTREDAGTPSWAAPGPISAAAGGGSPAERRGGSAGGAYEGGLRSALRGEASGGRNARQGSAGSRTDDLMPLFAGAGGPAVGATAAAGAAFAGFAGPAGTSTSIAIARGSGTPPGDDGAGGVSEGSPGSPYVLSDLDWRVAYAAASARASAGSPSRRGPRPPSGGQVLGSKGWDPTVAASNILAMTSATAAPTTAPSPAAAQFPAPFPPPASLRSAAFPSKPGPLVSRRLLGGISLELRLVATAVSGPPTGPPGPAEFTWVLPRYGIDELFGDLGLLPYLARFQEEAIRLDMLLDMDVPQLERLGLKPLGYCIRLREAVVDLARGLLRSCEEAGLLAVREAARQ